jgi:hypothetical protein
MSVRTFLRCVIALSFALLVPASVSAQLFRAYLASDGNDANPCTLAAPCRLLPAALAAVADGGEIWMLDSANYNTATVTIGKSVSILAIPGAAGSIVATSGAGVVITAAGLVVALRNLAIVAIPGGGGVYGVYMTGASELTIEQSLIANLPAMGVYVLGAGTVRIADTTIRNGGSYAVWLASGASASISRTQMLDNAFGGVLALGDSATTTTASVSESVISGGQAGVNANAQLAGAVAKIFVTRCTIEATDTALRSSATAGTSLVTASYSMVTKNTYGWFQSGAGSVIKTLGNNHIADNTTTSGTLTSAALQ